MKFKKRLLCLLIAFATLISCNTVLAKANVSETSTDKPIEVDFQTYKANIDYYQSLEEEGYMLIVTASAKDAADFDVLFSLQTSEKTNNLNIGTRGTGIPTAKWNVATQGQYDFSGTGKVNTNYRFTGSTGYNFTVKNRMSGSITIQVIEPETDTVLSQYSIPFFERLYIANFRRPSTASTFYIAFLAGPGMSFEGYVNKAN